MSEKLNINAVAVRNKAPVGDFAYRHLAKKERPTDLRFKKAMLIAGLAVSTTVAAIGAAYISQYDKAVNNSLDVSKQEQLDQQKTQHGIERDKAVSNQQSADPAYFTETH